MDRLRELDPEHLLYERTKPGPGGSGPLLLTPLELLDRLAALMRDRARQRPRRRGCDPGAGCGAPVAAPTPGVLATEPAHRRAIRYAWALMVARIYEVFPLVCSCFRANMRIIAFITDPPTIHDILIHLASRQHHPHPRVAPFRGAPLRDLPAAGAGAGGGRVEPAPEYEFNKPIFLC